MVNVPMKVDQFLEREKSIGQSEAYNIIAVITLVLYATNHTLKVMNYKTFKFHVWLMVI